jgi:CHASE2 domain-containing sensor protein
MHVLLLLLLLLRYTAIICLLQMHNIEDVARVSIFGTVGMLLAMVVVVGKLIAIYATSPPAAPTELVATGQGLNVSERKRNKQFSQRCCKLVHSSTSACCIL